MQGMAGALDFILSMSYKQSRVDREGCGAPALLSCVFRERSCQLLSRVRNRVSDERRTS